MMVRVPSCNIDRLIYIWRMEIKLKDTRTALYILQTRPSLVHTFLPQDKLLIQMHLDVSCNARASC